MVWTDKSYLPKLKDNTQSYPRRCISGSIIWPVYEPDKMFAVGELQFSDKGNMDELSGVSHMFSEDDFSEKLNRPPRRSLTLAERISVLKEYEKTPNARHLARSFQCGRTQIQNILRHRNQYLSIWSKSKERNATLIRRPHSPFLMATGLILFEWVKRARCYPLKITDDILRRWGQKIANHLKFTDFKPSNRWLIRFKQKYKLFDTELNKTNRSEGRAADRKPLDIAKIIEDIRQEHGHSKIPSMDEEDNSTTIGEYSNSMDPIQYYGKLSESYGSKGSCSAQNQQTFYDVPFEVKNEPNDSSNEFSNPVVNDFAKEIESYKEALNHLGPLEQFSLFKENIRAIGLINQLENLFRDEIAKNQEL